MVDPAKLTITASLMLLTACSSVQAPAPVVDNSQSTAYRPLVSERRPAYTVTTIAAPAQLPRVDREDPLKSLSYTVAQNVQTPVSNQQREVPEFYTIQQGDNLFRIASRYGLKYQDIAALNSINPNSLSIGQVIRLRPNESGVSFSTPSAIKTPISKPESQPSINKVSKGWSRPTKGTIIEAFKSGSNTGIQIEGVEGQPILSIADGRVVYADNTIRGYNNLILIQHSDGLITAYSNNKNMLVKVNENVKANQQIAQMGVDPVTNKASLKFEVRKAGNPIDPTPYLSR